MPYFNRIDRIAALGALLTFSTICLGQNPTEYRNTAQDMRMRIEAIVHKAAVPLQLSGPSSPVTITSAQIVFSLDDIREVQRYGREAVPVLSTFLLGEDPRSERVAIRLLGAIGGPVVVDPLVKVLDGSPRASSREEALRSLHNAPCSQASARAISHAARNDPNAIVRDLAQKENSYCSI